MEALGTALEGSGSSDDEGGDARPDNVPRRSRRPILVQLVHADPDPEPPNTPNHLGGLSRRWAGRSDDVERGNTPVTRNNSSAATRDIDENRRTFSRNLSASPSRACPRRRAASRSRSNSQAVDVVSSQPRSRRYPPRGQRRYGVQEPVARGPNGANFAARSASPRAILRPETVLRAASRVNHRVRVDGDIPAAFLDLEDLQVQEVENYSQTVTEPLNHQQAQSTIHMQPDLPNSGITNMQPQTTALPTVVGVEGGVCAGCSAADSQRTGICQHCGGPVEPADQSLHFHFGDWHAGARDGCRVCERDNAIRAEEIRQYDIRMQQVPTLPESCRGQITILPNPVSQIDSTVNDTELTGHEFSVNFRSEIESQTATAQSCGADVQVLSRTFQLNKWCHLTARPEQIGSW